MRLQTRTIRNTILPMPSPKSKPDVSPGAPPPHPRKAPVLDSATLFGGGNEVVIVHAGREYRLRRTRLDKLILTA